MSTDCGERGGVPEVCGVRGGRGGAVRCGAAAVHGGGDRELLRAAGTHTYTIATDTDTDTTDAHADTHTHSREGGAPSYGQGGLWLARVRLCTAPLAYPLSYAARSPSLLLLRASEAVPVRPIKAPSGAAECPVRGCVCQLVVSQRWRAVRRRLGQLLQRLAWAPVRCAGWARHASGS
jgi:hypothetical protein